MAFQYMARVRRFVGVRCNECRESIEIECVSNGSVSRALGRTKLPTENEAVDKLELWEERHECNPDS